MSAPARSPFVAALVALVVSASIVTAPPAAAQLPPSPLVSTADTIYYWNDTLLEAFRRQGGGPTPLARAAAMMHAAVFDTLNSAWRSRGPMTFFSAYLTVAPTTPTVDDNLAAGIVARDVLIAALPAQRTFVEQRYTQRHGSAGQPEAQQLAARVAGDMIAARTNDGSAPGSAYVPDGVPGAWEPTGAFCADATAAVTPQWGNVKPLAIPSGSAFRRPFPGGFNTYAALLASSLYATQFNEVKSLGRFDSATRTAEQSQIAWFWANDLDGTYKPPGQLLVHTRAVVEPRITDPLRVSRIFALVSLSMGDAAIAAWDQKYLTSIDLWRPQTAIQKAALDNNPNTAPDSAWLPLSADRNNVRFSPCFPAWVSGHATFAASWAGIMRHEFGDVVTYTAATEDPHAVGVTRTFNSFAAAASENARSRIYLGVHYQFDADDGLATGFAIANHINGRLLVSQRDPCVPIC